MQYDVAIIGGSYAGLSAALPLARARRSVVVIDHGQRRNRFASHSHGFLTQDGTLASEIAEIAREQISRYSTVQFETGQVLDVAKSNDLFHVCIDKIHAITAKRIIIATGVTDQLPEIQGLRERWGQSIFHCPYCHGYELNQGQIAVINSSEFSTHQAMMLPDWGQVTFLSNGKNLTDEERKQLASKNIPIIDDEIAEISEHATINLQSSASQQFDGIFVSSATRILQDWIKALGVEIESNGVGEWIKTDAMKQTSMDGVFASGDVIRFGGSVPLSVADGNLAGVSAHRSLIF
ncbi:Thioredoxin reductase [Acinetobacter marinus]|uniref:Thioredoxin reductase n=1 Tax=Acinetobacter marinus TaxID=281375 RepID=A0A1G6IQU5_9GAMM|nr:NAD(P)/FAD-dependent oxidoreductase [Acinetobacter marinus]SDC08879.1 Thioredoxin reductase [Acinetobacter marinus]